MRKPLFAANWKLNKSKNEVREFCDAFKGEYSDRDVLLCPSFVLLPVTKESVSGSAIHVCAQDLSIYDKGAYTGEVSGLMIREYADYVIVGHSERRGIFLDSDKVINKKMLMAQQSGLIPILCIGETLEEKELGKTEEIVCEQLKNGLNGVNMGSVVVAYEPVWAISGGDATHEPASPEGVQPVHKMIRNTLAEWFGEEVAASTRIIYGGSAKSTNIKDFMAEEDIDGGLVGTASLDPESFKALVNYDS